MESNEVFSRFLFVPTSCCRPSQSVEASPACDVHAGSAAGRAENCRALKPHAYREKLDFG